MGELEACEGIQKSVWGSVAASRELLYVTQKYGGVVIGADLAGRTVGFLSAFLARRRGEVIHWSHMMAVEEGYRDLGLGFRMKLAHRTLALGDRLKSICWTYDPLQSRNAYLNVHRLGALTDEYQTNCYGEFPSLIERSLPSDRFVVTWRIASQRVQRRLARYSSQHESSGGRREETSAKRFRSQLLLIPRVNQTRTNRKDLPENHDINLALTGKQLLVEIPSHTDQMRAVDLGLAREWRLQAREIFTRYFALRYSVEDFFPPCPETSGRCFYLLVRDCARGHARVSSADSKRSL
jgi:predicted GNAT superfamily acetyltransferase